jgi:P-type Cu+ transporter
MSTNPPSPAPTLERDPVCGMNVNPATAKHVYGHGGKNYYFCCAGCKEKFKASPQGYLNPPVPKSSPLVTLGMPAKPASAAPMHGISISPTSQTLPKPEVQGPRSEVQAAYVCPMCPEVHASKPGPCPPAEWLSNRNSPSPHPHRVHLPHAPGDRSARPGSCPICGMALEPRTVTACGGKKIPNSAT